MERRCRRSQQLTDGGHHRVRGLLRTEPLLTAVTPPGRERLLHQPAELPQGRPGPVHSTAGFMRSRSRGSRPRRSGKSDPGPGPDTDKGGARAVSRLITSGSRQPAVGSTSQSPGVHDQGKVQATVARSLSSPPAPSHASSAAHPADGHTVSLPGSEGSLRLGQAVRTTGAGATARTEAGTSAASARRAVLRPARPPRPRRLSVAGDMGPPRGCGEHRGRSCRTSCRFEGGHGPGACQQTVVGDC